jgi:hypothetical protein
MAHHAMALQGEPRLQTLRSPQLDRPQGASPALAANKPSLFPRA